MSQPTGQQTRSDESDSGNCADDLAALVQAANQRSSLLCKLNRAANVLRYYRTSQLFHRASRIVLPLLRKKTIPSLPLGETITIRDCSLEMLRSIAATRNVKGSTSSNRDFEDLAAGKITLLNQAQELGTPIDWLAQKNPHPSRLWTFQLHYHEFLHELAIGSVSESDEFWTTVWKIVVDWISENPPESSSLTGNAWHPYCISRRLPVWAQLFALHEPPAEMREIFLRSFANQAEVLSNNLEFDLGGNHLLENLRGLAVAGCFIEGSRSNRWLEVAEHQLRQQLPIQILSHGEHYERAPMYHCQVLGNLLQIVCLVSNVRDTLAEFCRPFAKKMRVFLQVLLHPDGEIPLFGDSCWGEAYSVGEIDRLSKFAGLEQPQAAEQGVTVVDRYWTWRHQKDSIIFDAGAVGADELPAHAHCDLLGFEASVEGQRWFVDSGLFDYEDSQMRAYCRSSAAHNVVTVDLQNNCDVWSRFRMGRRGRPRRFECGEATPFCWCLASHDGYRNLGMPELSRLMLTHACGTVVCLDHANRSAKQSLVGRLHLAPEVTASQVGPVQVLLNVGDSQRWLFFTPEVMLELIEGWNCDRFGKRTRTQVITYRAQESNPSCQPFGWSLSSSNEAVLAVSQSATDSYQVKIATNDSSEVFSVQFPN